MKPYFSRGVSFRVEIMERGINDTWGLVGLVYVSYGRGDG